MISQDQLIPTLILLLEQLRNAGQTRSRIAAVLNEKEEWQIQWSDEEATQTDNIQTIFTQLLSIYSPNCETNIPREVLIAHLGMLCPDVPEDLLFILQSVFSPASYGYCHDLEHIIHALGQSQIRKEIRTSPESDTTTHWSLAYDTHIGMRKAQLGQTNQDYFFFGLNNENALLMVADGISYSTAGSGNMASHIATQVVDHFWNTEKGKLLQATGDEIISFLKTALFNANIYICDMAKRLSKDKLEEEVPMGTTIVLAYLQKDTVYLTHLGDSRAYLITEDGAALLTGDHNIRGERIKHGIETDFNGGAALTRYLGYFNDRLEPSLPKIETRIFRMLPGEHLLLCSDGLNDYAAPNHYEMCQQIAKALEEESLLESCWELTRNANRGGGGDNVTLLLAQLQQGVQTGQ